MKDEVRIVLVGDSGVGKSSLISTLLKDSFQVNVPKVVREVTIPPSAARGKVTTKIVDTEDCENQDILRANVERADVVCVVYAVDDVNSFSRLEDYYLPVLTDALPNVPIVLVGNKIDTRGKAVVNNHLREVINPIMDRFKVVESVVECSAKKVLNVSDVFYFAQRAVIFPTNILYHSTGEVKGLTPACVQALVRIFKICDRDNDGVLNDDELAVFQAQSFNQDKDLSQLHQIKRIVAERASDTLRGDSLTLDGFLTLHTIFIERNKLEMTWTALRQFGYDDSLALREDFLEPIYEVKPTHTVELSSSGKAFLERLFRSHDKERKGALTPRQLAELFSIAPEVPWSNAQKGVRSNVNSGDLSLEGYMAQWTLTTFLDYRITLRYLAYLGYDGDTTRGLVRIRRKATPERSDKSVHHIVIFGAQGVGKSVVVQNLMGYSAVPGSSAVPEHYCFAVGSVHLVITEIPSSVEENEAAMNGGMLDRCDLAVLVYDPSSSTSQTFVNLLQDHLSFLPSPIPVRFIKSVKSPGSDAGPDAVAEVCATDNLLPPYVFSLPDGRLQDDLFSRVLNPERCVPNFDGGGGMSWFSIGLISLVVVGAAAGGAFYMYKQDGSKFKTYVDRLAARARGGGSGSGN